MMVRGVSIVSLILLAILVLYLPAAHPPERFVAQLDIEHAHTRAFWGEARAVRIVSRMLALHLDAQHASAMSDALADTKPPNPVDLAAASALSQVRARLLENRYAQSMSALLALAAYRGSALVEASPYVAVFILVAWLDGFLRRIVKSREFLQHQPEWFALHATLVIVVACGTVIALFLPLTVHPLLLALGLASIGLFGGLAIAHYHRRA